jgi:hypothetical protein
MPVAYPWLRHAEMRLSAGLIVWLASSLEMSWQSAGLKLAASARLPACRFFSVRYGSGCPGGARIAAADRHEMSPAALLIRPPMWQSLCLDAVATRDLATRPRVP